MAKGVFQNHPYTEGPRDKVLHITKDMVAPFIFPNPKTGMEYSNISYMYLSTEEFTCSSYDMAPGSTVAPPDYHEGDEVYIVLEGTLTMLNTEGGQVVRINAGESLLMPMGAKHSGYNFEDTKTRTMAFLAPKIFADGTFPVDEMGKLKIYNGKMDPKSFPKYSFCDAPNRAGVLDDLGKWPADGPSARKSRYFHYIPENRKILAIAGQDNPILMKICVSNDFMTVAQLVIPSGGKGARHTDPDKHAGDAVIYLDEGILSVLIHETGETFQLGSREALFIPKNTTYQLFNYESRQVVPLLCAVKL